MSIHTLTKIEVGIVAGGLNITDTTNMKNLFGGIMTCVGTGYVWGGLTKAVGQDKPIITALVATGAFEACMIYDAYNTPNWWNRAADLVPIVGIALLFIVGAKIKVHAHPHQA